MAYTTPITTYSDTTPQKRVVTDIISIIDPADTPAIDSLGGLDGASGRFNFVNGEGVKIEWLEDSLPTLTTTLAASISSGATAWTLASGSYIQVGQLLAAGTAAAPTLGYVTSVNGASVTVNTIANNASQSSGETVGVVGMGRVEGADSSPFGFTSIASNYNYTAIYHQEVKATRTARQISNYGFSDQMLYQQDKSMPHLLRVIEKSLFWNSARNAGDASSQGRLMGGFPAFVTTNTVSGTNFSTPSNVQGMFESALKLAFASGGNGPWKAFVSATNYQRIKNVYDNSAYLMVDKSVNEIGMVVERIRTPFGTVDLVLDRWARDNEIFIVDPAHAGFKTLYPFTWEALAKSGDADKAEVIGEFTFALRQNAAHAVIKNIT